MKRVALLLILASASLSLVPALCSSLRISDLR